MKPVRFLLFCSLLVGLTWMSGADAQTKRAAKGSKKAPSGGQAAPAASTPVSVAPVYAAPAVTQNTYHYHVYPQYSSAASSGLTGPTAAAAAPPRVTYVNRYYYVPIYVPVVASGAGAYALPRSLYGYSEPFVPILPRNTEPSSKEATIEILMPRSDAVLFVDGNKMQQTGIRRLFTSPELEPGTYSYSFLATWMNDGEEIRLQKTIEVSAGRNYVVDFDQVELPSGSAARDE